MTRDPPQRPNAAHDGDGSSDRDVPRRAPRIGYPAGLAVGAVVITAGRRRVALADRRTLGAVGFVRFASIGDADELAVLGPADHHVLTGFAEHSVQPTVTDQTR